MAEFSASQITQPAPPPGQFSASDITPVPAKQGFVSAFWEGIGGKALVDIMGGASRDPRLAQKSIDTLKGLASGLTSEGPRIMQELDSAGEAIRKGDWGLAAHHAAGAAPFIGAAVQQAGAELDRGDTSAAAGHTAALFAPFLAPKVPGAIRAAADTDAGAATIGAVKGAGNALVETKPITLKGVEIPVPTTVASAAAGGQAASMMGLPRSVGTVAGASAPIVRGAVKGAKAALAERLAAAVEKAQQATVEAPQQPPVRPPAGLLPAGPRVIQMGAAPDGSFVRSVPGQYPPNLPPEVLAELTRESQAPVPATPPPPVPAIQQFEQLKAQLPQADTPAATAPDPTPAPLAKDVAQQLYDEMKRGGTPVDAPPEPEEVNPFEAKARAKKVDTLASALNDAGQGYSRMSQLSGPELASTLQASAKLLGLHEFSGESISAVMAKLQELEAAKPAQPTAMQEFQAIKGKKTNGNGKKANGKAVTESPAPVELEARAPANSGGEAPAYQPKMQLNGMSYYDSNLYDLEERDAAGYGGSGSTKTYRPTLREDTTSAATRAAFEELELARKRRLFPETIRGLEKDFDRLLEADKKALATNGNGKRK